MITVIDSMLLSFFTKISHSFYRLTGKTNFFLAKIAIGVMIAGAITYFMAFWFPILIYKPPLFISIAFIFFSVGFIRDLNLCDKAEESAIDSERPLLFGELHFPIFRFSIFVVVLLIITVAPLDFISKKGYLIFKIVSLLYAPAFMAFAYLVNIDPPAPGKSKIREWIEAFSAGFRKPALVKAEK